jgi:outer membrane protein
MNKFKKLLIFLSILIFYSSAVLSADKIVYLDVDKVMSLSKAGKSIKAQLDKIHKSNISNFKKIEEKLKKEEQNLLSKKNVLSKEDFQKEFNRLKNEAAGYQKKRSKDIKGVNTKRIEASKKIINLMNPLLAKYSDENGIAIIISKKNIIMGQNQLDISDDIIKLIDSEIKPFKLK